MTESGAIRSIITHDTAAYSGTVRVEVALKLSIYQVARTSYASLNARISHPHWAISHVVRGNVSSVTLGVGCEARNGHVLIHPPNIPYVEIAAEAGTHEWIVFDAFDEHNIPLFEKYPVNLTVALESPDRYSNAFNGALSSWMDGATPFRQREASIARGVTEILFMLIEDWFAAGAPPRTQPIATSSSRFARTINYLSDNFAKRVTRTDLADRECLHPSSLDRQFRAVYGTTPMRMLNRIRLSRARELLYSTDRTLDGIAEECGFEDTTYFIRCFKAAFGITPGRYRSAAQASTNLYSTPDNLR